MTTWTSVLKMPPGRVAEALVQGHARDPEWLDEFADALDRKRQGSALERVLEVWGLSQSEAGRRLGVSRQAVAKWLAEGVPAERVESVAALSAATDLLVHHVKRDRIPAVVRRAAPALGDKSLLDLLAAGRYDEIVSACRAMFDFAAVQA